ncbi:phytanoyl-CoA dioxygenase family protein [Chloroflexi bacterium TSY]|nr:phytanoyl-CoA dioxygenase family protein [Chloroflexi bacterium TSY]
MVRLVEQVIPEPNDIEAQVDFFKANSYVILPDLLLPDEVAQLNEAIERDRASHYFMWERKEFTEMDDNSNLLLNEPIFETVIRRPAVLTLLDRLMGGPVCFEQLTVSHRDGQKDAQNIEWHRDKAHWMEHPLHLDYPQIIYYLTNVDESTHCFSISPEPADGEILLDDEAQLERGGVLNFYGQAGSAILFNCAALHAVTVRKTEKIRRTIQLYLGHEFHPSLSEITLIPPRLWRDHPDAETRRFYGKLNRRTKLTLQGLGVATFPEW